MPQTQLSSRLGSDNSIFDVKENAHISKSRFDFSRKNFTTIDIGGLYPVDFFQVYPGDVVDLSCRYILDTMPLAVPPVNNYFVRTHWYYVPMSALWKGWNTFITKGRSGGIDLTVPRVALRGNSVSDDTSVFSGSAYRVNSVTGLGQYLGYPAVFMSANYSSSPYYLPAVLTGYDTAINGYLPSVSVLPFLAYQKIYRYNYLPLNLMQDNKVWLPDDMQDEWRLDYSASNLSGLYFVPESASMPGSSVSKVANFVPSVSDNCVNVCQLRYATFGNDYFTTAKPWIVRGDQASVPMGSVVLGDFTAQVMASSGYYALSTLPQYAVYGNNKPTAGSTFMGVPSVGYKPTASVANSVGVAADSAGTVIPTNGASVVFSGVNESNVRRLYAQIPSQTASINANLSANTLRNLIALSVWQERNVLTNGNYNQYTQVHWRSNPRSPEYEPVYLGGTSDVINFTQVVQTSASTDSSPLGTQAARGNSSSGGKCFHFECRDYGYIMGIMFVQPEVVYGQGVPHEFLDLHNEDFYTPEFANLGFQPILNKEIFVTSDNDSLNNDLFGYQSRYSYLKQRSSVVSGMLSVPYERDNLYGSYVQSRRFSSQPELSAQFVTMSPSNIRRDFLAFPNYPAFKLQFASDVSLVRALPYQTTPETFGF